MPPSIYEILGGVFIFRYKKNDKNEELIIFMKHFVCIFFGQRETFIIVHRIDEWRPE